MYNTKQSELISDLEVANGRLDPLVRDFGLYVYGYAAQSKIKFEVESGYMYININDSSELWRIPMTKVK